MVDGDTFAVRTDRTARQRTMATCHILDIVHRLPPCILIPSRRSRPDHVAHGERNFTTCAFYSSLLRQMPACCQFENYVRSGFPGFWADPSVAGTETTENVQRFKAIEGSITMSRVQTQLLVQSPKQGNRDYRQKWRKIAREG